MDRSAEECNRRMLRAKDTMDRTFAEPLCIPRLARVAEVSEAHFIRTFRQALARPRTAISSAGA
jgi:transcriptional regulator GlxA family with amidase domain